MIRLSEIISKQVICLEEAEIVGTVSNVLFDFTFNKVRYLEVYSEDFLDSTKYLPVSKLVHTDNDAVIIKTRTSLLSLPDITDLGSPSPINSQCFSYDGAYLGTVNDILFTAQSVNSVLIKKSEEVSILSFPEKAGIMSLTPKNILSFSENIIIANDPVKPIKPIKRASVFKAKVNPPVKIHTAKEEPKNAAQPTVNPFETIIETAEVKSAPKIFTASASLMPEIPPSLPPAPIPLVLPKKVVTENSGNKNDISKYDFLLGKTLTETIMDEGETFIEMGEVITRETLEKAISKSKLIQIALHAE